MFTKKHTEAELLRSLERGNVFIKGLLAAMMSFAVATVALFIGDELMALPLEATLTAAGIAAAAAAPFAISLVREI